MLNNREFNICIIKPKNYEYSEIFMDQAIYYKYQFSKFGFTTTIGFNQLKKDVTNFVFGAWLGFDPSLKNIYACIFINLEQLGPKGSKNISSDYMDLLRSSPVIDYDQENVQYYAEPNTVPIAPIQYAPYLTNLDPVPLKDRNIDILFFGSMTERRIEIIQSIVDAGIHIEYIKEPTFGDKLYTLIRNSKCVLNIHAYDSGIFEQARASLCLSLGTPIISENSFLTRECLPYKDSIYWVDKLNLVDFFTNHFKSNEFYDVSSLHLRNFQNANDTADYLEITRLGNSFNKIHRDISTTLSNKTFASDIVVLAEEMHSPVLSICIPTFNRSKMLEETLRSITSQKVFLNTNKIEIIISDNCSTDNTYSISKNFTDKFSGKIFYYKNEVNIFDKNFGKCLSHGTGKLLKLHNDSFTFVDGALDIIINIIENKINEDSVLFFTNKQVPYTESITMTNSLDQFVSHASIQTTWIGGFCIWKNDFVSAEFFSKNSNLHLTQTENLLRLVKNKSNALIINEQVFSGINNKNTVPYDVSEVFGRNYINLLNEYVDDGLLKFETLITEKRNVFKKIILPFMFNNLNDFTNHLLLAKISNFKEDYYYEDSINSHKNSILNKTLNGDEFLIAWKKLNSHNTIEPQNVVPLSKVSVGKMSYGPIVVRWWGTENEHLKIGNFCSISSDVEFLLGGNHQHDFISTFPFKVKYFDQGIEATSKGPIIIKDDVWIGHRAMILSGVTIGQGAIIAAGTIVTKDVPAYSIVAGNPGKVVRYRFSKKIIDSLVKIDYSSISSEAIIRLKNLLSTPINENNHQSLLNGLISLTNSGNNNV